MKHLFLGGPLSGEWKDVPQDLIEFVYHLEDIFPHGKFVYHRVDMFGFHVFSDVAEPGYVVHQLIIGYRDPDAGHCLPDLSAELRSTEIVPWPTIAETCPWRNYCKACEEEKDPNGNWLCAAAGWKITETHIYCKVENCAIWYFLSCLKLL